MSAFLSTCWICDKCGAELIEQGDRLDVLPDGWAVVAVDFTIQEWCGSCAVALGTVREVAL